jgi:uncharacterized protein with GYD domain
VVVDQFWQPHLLSTLRKSAVGAADVVVSACGDKLSSGGNAMPIFISRGKFTAEAVKGMLAKPENREEAVSALFKTVGGKLIAWYLTFGRHDWLVIGEFPNEKVAASAIIAAAAGGSLSDIETTVAMTAKDAAATFEAAGNAARSFRSAGRS